MKIDPKYAFLHAFFLICPSSPFQNLSIWPKICPFFQFCTFLHPKRCTHLHCLVLKNNPNFMIFLRGWWEFQIQVPPPPPPPSRISIIIQDWISKKVSPSPNIFYPSVLQKKHHFVDAIKLLRGNRGPNENSSHSIISVFSFPRKCSTSLKLNKCKKRDEWHDFFSF